MAIEGEKVNILKNIIALFSKKGPDFMRRISIDKETGKIPFVTEMILKQIENENKQFEIEISKQK